VTERRRRCIDDFHGKFVSLRRQSILDVSAGVNASMAVMMWFLSAGGVSRKNISKQAEVGQVAICKLSLHAFVVRE